MCLLPKPQYNHNNQQSKTLPDQNQQHLIAKIQTP